MVNLIVAMDENFLIGDKNKLPWNNPSDMNLFKELTTGNIIIMGRKTYESIGKILPNRINIVVSRTLKETLSKDVDNSGNKLIISSSLEKAMEISNYINSIRDIKKDIYIIGGAKIYKEALDKNICSSLCISHIEGKYKGDTYFPSKELSKYKVIQERKYSDFIFKKYFLK